MLVPRDMYVSALCVSYLSCLEYIPEWKVSPPDRAWNPEAEGPGRKPQPEPEGMAGQAPAAQKGNRVWAGGPMMGSASLYHRCRPRMQVEIQIWVRYRLGGLF